MKKRILALLLAALVLLTACAKGPSWQEQYDLGLRYLSESNYQEAVIAFAAAIAIDEKRPEAYEGLADVYLQSGDLEKARDVLQQGLDKTGDERFQQRLDELRAELEPEAPSEPTPSPEPTPEEPQSGAETYSYEEEVTGADLDVDGQYLSVRVRDSRSATITVSGLSLQESYLINRSDSGQNVSEYLWQVVMEGSQTSYSVSTACWAFDPGAEEQRQPEEMQHSVWVKNDEEGTYNYIGDAEMSHTAESITWSFTVPEEYPFDFAKVERYVVTVFDCSTNLNLTRTYENLKGEHT